MLFDRFSNGPYLELIQKAFSPQHPVLRHTHYKGKVQYITYLCRRLSAFSEPFLNLFKFSFFVAVGSV